MSDSVRPHRWQPTRLPHPWDSPSKNTGLGCYFLLQCMKVKIESEVMSDSSQPHGLQPTRLLRPWDFPGKSGLPLPSPDIKISRHCTKKFTYICCFSLIHTSMGFSRQEYWVGCHALLQRIFRTRGLNPCRLRLLHWKAGSSSLVPPGKPCVNLTRALKWQQYTYLSSELFP